MIGMQVVRPALATDIEKLKIDFIHGYQVGTTVFYVSITNFQGLENVVTDIESQGWDVNWIKKDKEFEHFLNSHPKLHVLLNKFFYIWNGNHRHDAWMEFITRNYESNYDWHYRVRSIVLCKHDDVTSILTAMHGINRSTENSHVKSNIVHTLH